MNALDFINTRRVEKEENAMREKVERYERFLRALALAESPVASLDRMDIGEWAGEQAQHLLDGCEAECPVCSTPLHDGACVGEGEGEEDEADETPACEECGDRRGQCSHSS